MSKLPGRTQSYPALQRIAEFFQGLGSGNASTTTRHDSLELPRLTPRASSGVGGRGGLSHVSASDGQRPSVPSQWRPQSTASPKLVGAAILVRTPADLREALQKAVETGEWRQLGGWYSSTFGSPSEINTAFKGLPLAKDAATTETDSVQTEFVVAAYSVLLQTPQDLQKAMLVSVNSCLQKMRRPASRLTARTRSTDELRACFVLSLNPLFRDWTSYGVLANLLRHISELAREDFRILVQLYRSLDQEQFSSTVHMLNTFVSRRLNPSSDMDLPPISKSHWWIPSCCRMLAVLNAANEQMSPPQQLRRSEFCNSSLDVLDLFDDYCGWQAADCHGSSPVGAAGPSFFFCQYPFLLTIQAKRFILQKDSEQQMVDQARRYLTEVATQQHRSLSSLPSEVAFLNIMVHRSNLLEDTLNEIAQKKTSALRRKLHVTFIDEPGFDRGGLTKEWFMLLTREIFSAQRGIFVYDQTAGTYWFSFSKDEKKLKEFHLAGVLMGLAIYNGVNLDVRFPTCVYRKLLSPAVVPYNNPRSTVGVIDCTSAPLDDLKHVMPAVAFSLGSLLTHEGNVEKDLCLTFQVSVSQLGVAYTETLKPGGELIAVTASNRRDFVNLYADWIVNSGVYSQFRAFYHGFHSVCASNALLLLHPEEVEVLACGSDRLNMAELRDSATYSGYSPSSRIVRDFWDVVLSFPPELQKKLLLFTTGSDRLPVGGMSEMKFKICRAAGSSKDSIRLPTAKTCFNSLYLPPYKTKRILRQKLLIAVQNAEGFWLQ